MDVYSHNDPWTVWTLGMSSFHISSSDRNDGRSPVKSAEIKDGQEELAKLGGPINRTDSSRKVQSELD